MIYYIGTARCCNRDNEYPQEVLKNIFVKFFNIFVTAVK